MSMTGFARNETQMPYGRIVCELRSVNHRYLELNLKLADAYKPFEMALRATLKKAISRGKVDVQLYLYRDDAEDQSLNINEQLLQQIAEAHLKVSGVFGNAAPMNTLDLLRWPNVLQSVDLDESAVEEDAYAVLHETLQRFKASRKREGGELRNFVAQRLDDVFAHVEYIRTRLPEILEANAAKLRDKLDALKVDVDEDRLTQELVYISQKADVAEELDRTQSHLNEIRLALESEKPVGRRLDFLMQELNREANTLGSKSLSGDTTQTAVDLKVLIEQMREQIQNIE